jgi:hypothetical protein
MYRSQESHHHHHRLHKHPHRGAHRIARGEGRPAKANLRRRFFSREERIAGLEVYLNDLRAEAQAVEEELVRLKAAD